MLNLEQSDTFNIHTAALCAAAGTRPQSCSSLTLQTGLSTEDGPCSVLKLLSAARRRASVSRSTESDEGGSPSEASVSSRMLAHISLT